MELNIGSIYGLSIRLNLRASCASEKPESLITLPHGKTVCDEKGLRGLATEKQRVEMAESAVTETASPDKQPDLTGQAKKTIQTKGNVVIFAMDGSDIAINALKCEFTILYLIYDYISFSFFLCIKDSIVYQLLKD